MQLQTRPAHEERRESGARIARDAFFSLLGLGLPLVAAVLAIPPLAHGLGPDRFGLLTIAWIVIGYFSLFDLGLGRALTQLVAAHRATEDGAGAPEVAWSGLGAMFALGLVGAAVLGTASPWLVHSVLKMPAPMRAEALHSFYVLAAAIPVVVLTAGLAGILSAFNKFALLSAIRAPLGAFTFLAPLAVLPFSRSLVAVSAALVVGRVAAGAAHFLAARRVLPRFRTTSLFSMAGLPRLLHYGAWMTVSNIVGPVMLYLDRFVIGSTLDVAAVAYYSTPYEMVTKILVIPGAILGVLFPAFAAAHQRDPADLLRLFVGGTKHIALLLFPVLFIVVSFAPEILRAWLDVEFVRHSTSVLRCLSVGVFINALAQVTASLIQGVGRPDLSARLHLIELPLYVGLVWFAVHGFGILGAALAWTARVTLDAALLFVMSRRYLANRTGVFRKLALGLIAALAVLLAPVQFRAIVPRAAITVVVLVVFVPVSWRFVLGEDERASLKARFAKVGRLG